MTTNPTAARTATITGLTAEPATRSVPQPTFVDIAPWWVCPPWCDKGDNCYGGEALNFGGQPATVTHRHHAKSVLVDTVDDIDGGTTDVSVEVEAVEDPTDGFIDGALVTLSVPLTTVDADTAERIANAILAAVAAARQPLPAVPATVQA